MKRVTLLVESFVFKLYFKINNVLIGKNFRIKGLPYIRNAGTFIIKNNVRINSRISANPIGGNCKCYFVIGKNAKFTIGNGVAISNTAFNCYESITIEENVMIGGNCKIYDTDFHPLNTYSRLKNDKTKISKKTVIIKKNAFIGAHTIILKGVTIGENAIIGAGSVITKDVPDNQIWAGNPAKFIKPVQQIKYENK